MAVQGTPRETIWIELTDGVPAAERQGHGLEREGRREQPARPGKGLLEVDDLGAGAVGEAGGILEVDGQGGHRGHEAEGPVDQGQADGAAVCEDGRGYGAHCITMSIQRLKYPIRTINSNRDQRFSRLTRRIDARPDHLAHVEADDGHGADIIPERRVNLDRGAGGLLVRRAGVVAALLRDISQVAVLHFLRAVYGVGACLFRHGRRAAAEWPVPERHG